MEGTDHSAAAIYEIQSRVLALRGQKILLDADLAELYGTPTKRFNEQVKRNLARFPADFMFQLTEEEFAGLRSQIATSNGQQGRGGRRHLPFAFTEHGAIMAATILNSPQATEVSVYVVRTFVQLRSLATSNKETADRVTALEAKLKLLSLEQTHFTHEAKAQFEQIFGALRALMAPPTSPGKRQIGFVHSDNDGPKP